MSFSAKRVVAKFMGHKVGFNSSPLASQVKDGLYALYKKADLEIVLLRQFKEEIHDKGISAYDEFTDENVSKAMAKVLQPAIAKLKSIHSDDISFDHIADVLQIGKQFEQVKWVPDAGAKEPPTSGSRSPETLVQYLRDIGKDLVEVATDLQSKLMPITWWSRNLDQISMVAKMVAASEEDHALVQDIADLAKTVQSVHIVGGSMTESYAKVMDLAKKAIGDLSKLEKAKAAPKSPAKAAPKSTKKPTFAEARKVIFDRLRKDGWYLSENLKVPHATSPSKQVRLWFRAQSVYGNDEGAQVTDTKNIHSWISDLREYADPDAFISEREYRQPCAGG